MSFSRGTAFIIYCGFIFAGSGSCMITPPHRLFKLIFNTSFRKSSCEIVSGKQYTRKSIFNFSAVSFFFKRNFSDAGFSPTRNAERNFCGLRFFFNSSMISSAIFLPSIIMSIFLFARRARRQAGIRNGCYEIFCEWREVGANPIIHHQIFLATLQ